MPMVRVSNGGTGYDTSFTPQRTTDTSVAGTNFTVGKYYIVVSGSSYASQAVTGASVIVDFDYSGDGRTRVRFVQATSNQIKVGNHIETTSKAMPLEFSF